MVSYVSQHVPAMSFIQPRTRDTFQYKDRLFMYGNHTIKIKSFHDSVLLSLDSVYIYIYVYIETSTSTLSFVFL